MILLSLASSRVTKRIEVTSSSTSRSGLFSVSFGQLVRLWMSSHAVRLTTSLETLSQCSLTPTQCMSTILTLTRRTGRVGSQRSPNTSQSTRNTTRLSCQLLTPSGTDSWLKLSWTPTHLWCCLVIPASVRLYLLIRFCLPSIKTRSASRSISLLVPTVMVSKTSLKVNLTDVQRIVSSPRDPNLRPSLLLMTLTCQKRKSSVLSPQLSSFVNGLTMATGLIAFALLRTTSATCKFVPLWAHLVVVALKSLTVCSHASTSLTTFCQVRLILREFSRVLPHSNSTTSLRRSKPCANHLQWEPSNCSTLCKSNFCQLQHTPTMCSTCVTSPKCSKVFTWLKSRTKTPRST